MLNNLVANSQPGGANPMSVNGLDLPVPGPAAPGAQGGPGMGGMNQTSYPIKTWVERVHRVTCFLRHGPDRINRECQVAQ